MLVDFSTKRKGNEVEININRFEEGEIIRRKIRFLFRKGEKIGSKGRIKERRKIRL